MVEQHDGTIRLSTEEWIKLMAIVFVNSLAVFGGLLFWANRIVAVEVRVNTIETAVASGMTEVRSDIKEILKRTKE